MITVLNQVNNFQPYRGESELLLDEFYLFSLLQKLTKIPGYSYSDSYTCRSTCLVIKTVYLLYKMYQ